MSTAQIAKRIRADIKLARNVEAKLGTATGTNVALVDHAQTDQGIRP
ncbi:hypothetical protein [Streptomyces agglomeratus]|nr:hypothetical protein [Streptomyces agglomeratus]